MKIASWCEHFSYGARKQHKTLSFSNNTVHRNRMRAVVHQSLASHDCSLTTRWTQIHNWNVGRKDLWFRVSFWNVHKGRPVLLSRSFTVTTHTRWHWWSWPSLFSVSPILAQDDGTFWHNVLPFCSFPGPVQESSSQNIIGNTGANELIWQIECEWFRRSNLLFNLATTNIAAFAAKKPVRARTNFVH